MNTDRVKIANIIRNVSRYTLLFLGILVFIFALLSGSEDYGSGISRIIKNSPNVLPWFILLVLVAVAWKWELNGGIIITLLGLGMIYFFNFSGPNFFLVIFILTALITIIGVLLLSWHLRENE